MIFCGDSFILSLPAEPAERRFHMYYVAAAGHDTLGDYNEVVLYRTEDLEETEKEDEEK